MPAAPSAFFSSFLPSLRARRSSSRSPAPAAPNSAILRVNKVGILAAEHSAWVRPPRAVPGAARHVGEAVRNVRQGDGSGTRG